MVTSNNMSNQFLPYANVGNTVIVLIIVLVGIIKPAGAFMV
jgi:hypothetical protein